MSSSLSPPPSAAQPATTAKWKFACLICLMWGKSRRFFFQPPPPLLSTLVQKMSGILWLGTYLRKNETSGAPGRKTPQRLHSMRPLHAKNGSIKAPYLVPTRHFCLRFSCIFIVQTIEIYTITDAKLPLCRGQIEGFLGTFMPRSPLPHLPLVN